MSKRHVITTHGSGIITRRSGPYAMVRLTSGHTLPMLASEILKVW